MCAIYHCRPLFCTLCHFINRAAHNLELGSSQESVCERNKGRCSSINSDLVSRHHCIVNFHLILFWVQKSKKKVLRKVLRKVLKKVLKQKSTQKSAQKSTQKSAFLKKCAKTSFKKYKKTKKKYFKKYSKKLIYSKKWILLKKVNSKK